MKKRIRKFTLHRETLRNLTEARLLEVPGGNFTGRNTFCPSACAATCVTQCDSVCHCTGNCN
ncbi:MAG TPA: hypothetical protein VFE33_23300 [Thermoanaerobaculia bacterium]|nr:hypothetical protein [Thermoanaerobaculia bacterium]